MSLFARLITPEDEETYGTELIDLMKRAAKEAMDLELSALKRDLLSKLSALGASNSQAPPPQPAIKLVTAEDEETYGAEFIDSAKRAAKDAMAPELIGLRQE